MHDKKIEWNKEKNKKLVETRKVSFEQISEIITTKGALYIINHPDKQKYPKQKLMFININNYIYYLPFVEDEEKIFLKTIIPSRKATKELLIKKNKKWKNINWQNMKGK